MRKKQRAPNQIKRSVKFQLSDGSYRSDVRKLLAVLVCIAVVVGIVALARHWLPTRDTRETSLKRQLVSHIESTDFDAALSCLYELQKLSPDNLEFDFQMAQVEQVRGNTENARNLINKLIDAEHIEAAAWELENEFNQLDQEWDESKQARLEQLVALARKSKDIQVRVRAQQRWVANRCQVGAREEALDALSELTREDPASSVHAASLAKQLGRTELVQRFATLAKKHFGRELSRRPTDDQCRLNLSRAYLILDQEEDAIRLLSDGFVLTRQPKLQQAAGEAMICWANRLKATGGADRTSIARLKLVHRATQCAPSDQAVLSAVIELVTEYREAPEHYQTRLREWTAQGIDPESSHFMLGLLALTSNDTVNAKLHLDLAEQLGSHLATVLNNLALATLEDSRLSLDQGLMFADQAIARLDSEPRFRETRSRYLLRQGRYAEAIEDLKCAQEVEELQEVVQTNLVLAQQALSNLNRSQRGEND